MGRARAVGKGRILVTGGDQPGVLAAVRALRAGGYEPWVAVPDRRVYAGRSRAAAGAVLVPHARLDGAGFAEAVDRGANTVGARAILPGGESCLVALAQPTSQPANGAVLASPSRESVELATDKVALVELARASGFATPRTSPVELERLDEVDLPFPLVVKPRRSLLPLADGTLESFHARRADSPAELADALRALPDRRGLVQPFLPGRLAAVAGVFWEGELVAPVHFAADRIWPLPCGIMAHAVTVERDPRLEEATRRLLASIDWHGIFQLQFIEHEGTQHLIDFNPRVFTSLPLPIAAGANLPAIWMDLLLGEPCDPDGYRVGVGYRYEAHELRALLHFVRRGDARKAVDVLVPRRRTTHLVFSARDPRPMLTTLERASAGAVARLRRG